MDIAPTLLKAKVATALKLATEHVNPDDERLRSAIIAKDAVLCRVPARCLLRQVRRALDQGDVRLKGT